MHWKELMCGAAFYSDQEVSILFQGFTWKPLRTTQELERPGAKTHSTCQGSSWSAEISKKKNVHYSTRFGWILHMRRCRNYIGILHAMLPLLVSHCRLCDLSSIIKPTDACWQRRLEHSSTLAYYRWSRFKWMLVSRFPVTSDIIRLIDYQKLCLDSTIEDEVEGKTTGRATQILHIEGCASQLFQELLLETWKACEDSSQLSPFLELLCTVWNLGQNGFCFGILIDFI